MEDDSDQFYSTEELARACEEAGFPVNTYSNGNFLKQYKIYFADILVQLK